MDLNKLFQSKIFKIIVFGIVGLIVVLLIFKAGTLVGFRKAGFSYKWGENYHQNFAGPRGGFFRDFSGRDFIEAHGVFGQIIKIDTSTSSAQVALVIKGRDDIEKIVLIKDDTVIKRFAENTKPSDLKIDDLIVVIGEPNDNGQIEAKLIRIMPASPKLQRGEPPPPIGTKSSSLPPPPPFN